MKRLIIVGSPRSNGRSAHLAEMLFEANIDERPEDELFLVPVSEIEVGPCIGCSACRAKTEVTFKNDEGEEVTELRHRCVFDDDMQTLYDLLDDVDELTIVCPVYFSGAPSSMKCVLDRLQPYFWVNQRGRDLIDDPLPGPAEKRPATLHVVGEGADPHGYGALVSEVKSALACGGFRLERVFDWVGRVNESGEIEAEATEIDIQVEGVPRVVEQMVVREEGQGAFEGAAQSGSGSSDRGAAATRSGSPAGRKRPRLDLSSSKSARQDSSRNQQGQKGGSAKGASPKGGASRGASPKGGRGSGTNAPKGGGQKKGKRRG